MAVQAQHPSILFFPNRNNGQELQDFSLQPQAGEFLDQTHFLLNNGGSNQRKRGRETMASMNNVHQFSLQSQNPQVIDLSLLHNQQQQQQPYQPPQNAVVSTGLRLFSGEDQPQNISNHFHQQYRQHQNLVSTSSSSGFFSFLNQDFTAQINRQQEELDEFLNAQADELRHMLAEKRQRQYSALIGAVEEPLIRKLKEKEAEVERATCYYKELEARAAQLSAEAQAWQERARMQEATAASLQAKLQQAVAVKNTFGVTAYDSRVGEEGLLCAGVSGFTNGTEDAESAYVDPDRMTEESTGLSCKMCRRKAATVVLLPCRHLCLCPECDRAALACPLCLTLRNNSVEARLW